jgi:hypothetical protein
MSPFKPEYAGKMSFYLSAVDDLLRHPEPDGTGQALNAVGRFNNAGVHFPPSHSLRAGRSRR